MQQPLSVNKNLTNMNSSTTDQSNIKCRNLADKQPSDGFAGFCLQRVPTTSTVAISKDQTTGSKSRCVSQNKSDTSGQPAPASVGGPSEINVTVTPLKATDKMKKLKDFKNFMTAKIESGDHLHTFVKDLHSSQQEREVLDNVLALHG